MSEYQYYEFLALDRPLSAEEMAYVRTLSSRVRPTPTQAAFTYSYGDFPGDPLKLLAKHYDVMLYLANWGSRRLAFRFPKRAIDQAALQPYYYGVDEIELKAAGQHVILDIAFHDGAGRGDVAALSEDARGLLAERGHTFARWLHGSASATAA